MKKTGQNNLTSALIGLGIMLLLSAGLIAVSEPLYKAVAGRNRPVTGEVLYNPGIYEGSARGYGGIVTVRIEVTEQEIKDVKILAPDETPEIGKAVAVELSKDIWLKQSNSVDSVSGATMTSNAVKKAFSECLRQAVKPGTELAKTIEAQMAEEVSEKAIPEIEEILASVKDGTYFYQDEMQDGNGFYNVMEVTVRDHKITDILWDAVNDTGEGKRSLSQAGEYSMTEHGPKWYEQSDLISQYVILHQSTENLAADAGTTDTMASVSIHTGGFTDVLKKCLLLAAGDLSHAGIGDLLKVTPDGSYSYLSETADDKGFREQIQLTVSNHEITALIWDCVNAEGIGKRNLSEEGQYNMTENGPKWYEQADTLAEYVLLCQSASGLENAEGRTDSVASVSISVDGFMKALKNCLLLANGEVSSVTIEGLLQNRPDGEYTYTSDRPDDKGFCDQIRLTVNGRKITSLVWDSVNSEGVGKRQLSEEGSYTMTEDGALWYAQADALADYIIKNQSEEGLMDSSGYVSAENQSDAVASVSIYIGGFMDSVRRCLAQQTGN